MQPPIGEQALEDQDFQAGLENCVRECIGREDVAPYAVNEAMIGMWADALLDDNPVYMDAAAARATGRPGVIAPPTMIQAWTMPELSRMARGAKDVPGFAPYLRPESVAQRAEEFAKIYGVLAERGFTNSLATNCRQTYHRELALGDRVRCISTVEAVSTQKRTAMGVGHFVTTRLEYLDQERRPVATQLWTFLRFRTPENAALVQSGAATAVAPVVDHSFTAEASALIGPPRTGMTTAATVIPITPTFVAATAFATRDFYAIHHDPDWARSIGRPNIFSNILTTTGLVGGVFTRWGGPAVRLRALDLRLLVPNYPGDELTLRGVVTAVDGEDVTLRVTGVNRLGTHVEAVVTGTIPAER